MLLNATIPEAILSHDFNDSLIDFPVGDNSRYYVMFKGLDPLDYGLRSATDMQNPIPIPPCLCSALPEKIV